MLSEDTFEFETEDEARKGPPAGTHALVQVRANKEGEREVKTGAHAEYGPWMNIPFEVVEGEFRGEWANMMLNLKTNDLKFRRTFEVVTGVDVKDGAKVTKQDFMDKLLSGVFEAEIGPDKRPGNEQYTRCYKIVNRVRDIDAASSAAGADDHVPAIGDEAADEDIPF